MAKSVYKIPSSLDASYLDMEIALQSNDGIGVRPYPLKVILVYLLSGIGCVAVLMNGFPKYGTVFQKILFVALWVALTFFLGRYDSTHRMYAERIPTVLTYVQKNMRKVLTRKSSVATPFYSIAGFKKEGVDKKTGLISFMDGTYGYMYRIVGSASILLFESDKKAILDRVEQYYQKVDVDVEHIFLTTKSSQAVYKQMAALKATYDSLDPDDTELRELCNEQFRVLKNYVGGSFKAIHQYLIIKADNKEALVRGKRVLASEVENSSLMIKRCVPLYYDDIVAVMQLIYQGKDGGKT